MISPSCRIQRKRSNLIIQIVKVFSSTGREIINQDVVVTEKTRISIIDLDSEKDLEKKMNNLYLDSTPTKRGSPLHELIEFIMYPIIYPCLMEKLGINLPKGRLAIRFTGKEFFYMVLRVLGKHVW